MKLNFSGYMNDVAKCWGFAHEIAKEMLSAMNMKDAEHLSRYGTLNIPGVEKNKDKICAQFSCSFIRGPKTISLMLPIYVYYEGRRLVQHCPVLEIEHEKRVFIPMKLLALSMINYIKQRELEAKHAETDLAQKELDKWLTKANEIRKLHILIRRAHRKMDKLREKRDKLIFVDDDHNQLRKSILPIVGKANQFCIKEDLHLYVDRTPRYSWVEDRICRMRSTRYM